MSPRVKCLYGEFFFSWEGEWQSYGVYFLGKVYFCVIGLLMCQALYTLYLGLFKKKKDIYQPVTARSLPGSFLEMNMAFSYM